MFVAVFRRLGLSVAIATDGMHAPEILSAGDFAIIFMDRHMPGIDGLETTRIIRSHEQATKRHVPIICTTATSMDDVSVYKEGGMDGMISKLIRIDEIVRTIEQFTGYRLTPKALADTD